MVRKLFLLILFSYSSFVFAEEYSNLDISGDLTREEFFDTIYTRFQYDENVWVRKNNDNYKNEESGRLFLFVFKGTHDDSISIKVIAQYEEIDFKDFSVGGDYSLSKVLNTASVAFLNIDDTPVGLLVGKDQVAFGHKSPHMPIYFNDSIIEVNRFSEVFTLNASYELDEKSAINLIEASFFESGEDDLYVDDKYGQSIRITKNITDHLHWQLSYLNVDYEDPALDSESRVSTTLWYDNPNSGVQVWANLIHLDNFRYFPESEHMYEFGVAKQFRSHRLILKSDILDKSYKGIGAGYTYCFYKCRLSVGTEVRYLKYEKESQLHHLKDDISFGLNFEYKFINYRAR